jgi:hypothetical protein
MPIHREKFISVKIFIRGEFQKTLRDHFPEQSQGDHLCQPLAAVQKFAAAVQEKKKS